MIRRYGRIDAPRELVQSIFAKPEEWPLWFPGVVDVKVVHRSDAGFEVEVEGRYMGRRMYGRIECSIEPHGFTQRQLSGWLKKWDTRWRFVTPPDGRGTTLACEVDLDLGLVGVLTPSRMIAAFVDRVFGDTVEQLNRRAQELLSESAEPEPATTAQIPLLEVYETPEGLEVWVAGRRYLLEQSP